MIPPPTPKLPEINPAIRPMAMGVTDHKPIDHGPTDHGPTDHGPPDHEPAEILDRVFTVITTRHGVKNAFGIVGDFIGSASRSIGLVAKC